MKIRFTATIEIEDTDYPQYSKSELREEVLSYLNSYTDEGIERCKSYLADENLNRQWAMDRALGIGEKTK
jgi:hypothetical protein